MMKNNKKNRKIFIQKNNDTFNQLVEVDVLSFRDNKHLDQIIDELITKDNPVAFHGWGVSGVAGRVDKKSHSEKFWTVKKDRPLLAKIPLLEPPEYVVSYVDWENVHPDFRFLKNPNKLNTLWKSRFPFHIIFPYKQKTESLADVVITPANTEGVTDDTPFATFCAFWAEDPALRSLLRRVKKINPNLQIGVTSLNDHGEPPPFNTKELIEYLQIKQRSFFKIIVEDPLLEPLDIASSHSQFVIPLIGQKPEWTMKRKGSLSAQEFSKSSGFKVVIPESLKLVPRRSENSDDLDVKLKLASKKIGSWYRAYIIKRLFERLRIFNVD